MRSRMALRSCFRCSRRRLRASRCGSLMPEFVALGCSGLVYVVFVDVSFEGQLFGGSSSGLFFFFSFSAVQSWYFCVFQLEACCAVFLFSRSCGVPGGQYSSESVVVGLGIGRSVEEGEGAAFLTICTVSAHLVHPHARRPTRTHTHTRARCHMTARAPRSTHVRACRGAALPASPAAQSVSSWRKKCARVRAHNSALCGLTVKHHSRSHKCSSSSSCRNVTTHRVEPTRT